MTSISIHPVVNVSRRDSFSVSHYLNSPWLSSTGNKQAYGQCNNPEIHSHSYTVLVTCRGAVSSNTGTVLSLTDLQQHMNKAIIEELHEKNLNLDVPYFRTVPSTIENLAVYIWNNLKMELLSPHLLFEIELSDNDNNTVVYNGTTVLENSRSNNRGQTSLTSDTD